MGKQLIPLAVLKDLEPLPLVLPDFGMDSPPFSWGERPEEYTLDALKKVEKRSTNRTDQFRKYVLAIEELIGAPAPFVFRTADGKLRSMDAGCLGFCVHRRTPYFTVRSNERGFIGEVESTRACDGQRPLIPKLVEEIRKV